MHVIELFVSTNLLAEFLDALCRDHDDATEAQRHREDKFFLGVTVLSAPEFKRKKFSVTLCLCGA